MIELLRIGFSSEYENIPSGSIKGGKFFTSFSDPPAAWSYIKCGNT
jgi:hypothetical protein